MINSEELLNKANQQAAAIAGPWLKKVARHDEFVEWAKERRAINKEIDAKLTELGL